AGPVPAIHVFLFLPPKTWMPGTSSGMTKRRNLRTLRDIFAHRASRFVHTRSPGKIDPSDLGAAGDHVGYRPMTRLRQCSRCTFRGRRMTEHLIVTDDQHTRVIKMRRPEKKNAMTQGMYRAMSDAIDTAQNNPDIRCFMITGGSGVFTAGNDLED